MHIPRSIEGLKSRSGNLLRRLWFGYWRRADSWFFRTIGRFLKALVLLGLWLFVGFLVFRFLLPIFLRPYLPEVKETIALLGTLLTALIGFGVQQWRELGEEEERQNQKLREAMEAVDELGPLIRENPSEGARRYEELWGKGGIWQSGRVRISLEETWEKNAPEELKLAIKVLAKQAVPADERAEHALLWAYDHLDEGWCPRIEKSLEALSAEGSPGAHRQLQQKRERLWLSLLGIWPEIVQAQRYFYTGAPQIQGLCFLGLQRNPFGPEKAEIDPLFLREVRCSPAWWNRVAQDRPGFFLAAPGGGRTAAAMLLAYDTLQSGIAFPAYWPLGRKPATADGAAQVIARSLAHYIALRPGAFIARPYSVRVAIARLLINFLSDPLGDLRRAGLPSIGEGQRVFREMESCLSAPRMDPGDFYTLLEDARLVESGWSYLLLVDVWQEPSQEAMEILWGLTTSLATRGCLVKCFLPASPVTEPMGETLVWSDEDLRTLLKKRFELLGENLEGWCDREWEGPPLVDRLVAAARGNPGRLISTGNDLLRRIGQTRRLLTPLDVNTVLRQ